MEKKAEEFGKVFQELGRDAVVVSCDLDTEGPN